MTFTTEGLKKAEKIGMLQRWIIVQSILYYVLDFNLVSDEAFDRNCSQLVEFMNKYPNGLKHSQYCYCMNDFDGSTGFDLYNRLNKKDRRYLRNIAERLKLKNKNRKGAK